MSLCPAGCFKLYHTELNSLVRNDLIFQIHTRTTMHFAQFHTLYLCLYNCVHHYSPTYYSTLLYYYYNCVHHDSLTYILVHFCTVVILIDKKCYTTVIQANDEGCALDSTHVSTAMKSKVWHCSNKRCSIDQPCIANSNQKVGVFTAASQGLL